MAHDGINTQQLLTMLLAGQSQAQPPAPAAAARTGMTVGIKLANAESGHASETDCHRLVKKSVEASDMSIAEWARETVCQKEEFLLKICHRDKQIRKTGKGIVRLLFGNGFDVLVSLNGADFPTDMSSIPKIEVLVCIATLKDDNDAERLDVHGEANPTDKIWDHLQDQLNIFSENYIRVYLHTQPGGFVRSDDRVNVVRIWTKKDEPWNLYRYQNRPDLEEELRETGKLGKIVDAAKKGASIKKEASVAAKADSKEPSTQTTKAQKMPPVAASKEKSSDNGDDSRKPSTKTTKAQKPPPVAASKEKSSDAGNDEEECYAKVAESPYPKVAARSKEKFDVKRPAVENKPFNPREIALLAKAFRGTLKKKDEELDNKTFSKNDLKYARRMLTEMDKPKSELGRHGRAKVEPSNEKSGTPGPGVADAATATPEKKPRGRPKGSTNKKSKDTGDDGEKSAKKPKKAV